MWHRFATLLISKTIENAIENYVVAAVDGAAGARNSKAKLKFKFTRSFAHTENGYIWWRIYFMIFETECALCARLLGAQLNCMYESIKWHDTFGVHIFVASTYLSAF